jgi:hypothetical protein
MSCDTLMEEKSPSQSPCLQQEWLRESISRKDIVLLLVIGFLTGANRRAVESVISNTSTSLTVKPSEPVKNVSLSSPVSLV